MYFKLNQPNKVTIKDLAASPMLPSQKGHTKANHLRGDMERNIEN